MSRNSLRGLIVAALLLGAFGCVMLASREPSQNLVQEPEISEASGLAASQKTPGLLYTHNDSGGQAVIYVLNASGLMPAKIQLSDATNRDWEDIAVARDPRSGVSHVLVGDIGDNSAVRPSCVIYRFAEPELSDTLLIPDRVDRLEFSYEDGPRDAEALFADPRSGDIYILAKREEKPGIYRIPYPQDTAGPYLARRVGSMPFNWITAADCSPNGRYILVKTYSHIYRYKRKNGQSVAEALAGKPRLLTYLAEDQGEAVAWDISGKGYFTLSERLGDTPVALIRYP